MAQTFKARIIHPGRAIDYTPGSAVAAGEVVVDGALVGVAPVAIAAGQLGSLEVGAVVDFVKANGAITRGAAVYWDADGNPQGGTAGTGAATTTASGNTFIGYPIAAAAETAEVVRLQMGFVSSLTVHSPLSAQIADPGNGGAIPVTNSGHVQIVTAGAETRTLAAPTFVGQELLLCMKTDGGDCVITCATTFNATGNNTITMNDAGDNIRLQAIQVGSNIRWRTVVNEGCTASTV